MKILFTILNVPDGIANGGMYTDLAIEFSRNGHDVTVIGGSQKETSLYEDNGIRVLRVKSLPILNVKNMIHKGIGMAMLPLFYRRAFDRYLRNDSFDWVVMPTPPITLSGFIGYVKRRSGARFYLVLRDIHPQSIGSIGLLKHKWMYRYLDRKARSGYHSADIIGCMSEGNIDFIKSQYPGLCDDKLTLLYNWQRDTATTRDEDLRDRYGLKGKFVVLFGGVIGKGQRIENLLFLAEQYRMKEDILFLVIGKGVEKERMMTLAQEKNMKNIRFMDFMPQNDYLRLTASVDLGLISINERYAVPTCPSKALSYMCASIPVFAMINPNNDYGEIIESSGAGWKTQCNPQSVADTIIRSVYALRRNYIYYHKAAYTVSLKYDWRECAVQHVRLMEKITK